MSRERKREYRTPNIECRISKEEEEKLISNAERGAYFFVFTSAVRYSVFDIRYSIFSLAFIFSVSGGK
ncbi:MAG: hypothetical protein CVU64_03545 [Deltaproteobacteria bacterium HGW-Deltaproteobacteria-21]|nr:MAG: hypothetical protein CVU64_03545 [Deltaproteobacteria bacterium HGW-Deltaproteobacteria-21]